MKIANAITTTAFQAAVPAIDHDGQQMFDARQLHAWLGVRDYFGMWMSRRIAEYGWTEGEDFYATKRKTGGRPRTDYLITLDMAKELAMVERTERGRGTRRYFIEMEKVATQMARELSGQGLASLVPQAFYDARAEIEGLKRLIEERLPQPQAFLLPAGYFTARQVVERFSLEDSPSALGWELTLFCQERGFGIKVKSGGKYKPNTYPAEAVSAFLSERGISPA